MHDMIMTFYFGKLYRLKYVLEKKLWKFDNPPMNYRSVMSDNNGIFVMRPEMFFFSGKKYPVCLCRKLQAKFTKYQYFLFFLYFVKYCRIMIMKRDLKSLELLLYEYKIFIRYGPSQDGHMLLPT